MRAAPRDPMVPWRDKTYHIIAAHKTHETRAGYIQPHLCLRVRSRGSASSRRPPSGFTSRETRAATGSTLKACMPSRLTLSQDIPGIAGRTHMLAII